MKKACLLLMAFGLSATLVWRTEAKECGPYDYYQCGDSCIGDENTCTCGDSEPWKGINWKEGCCPSSSGSCIIDQKTGKDSFKKRNQNINLFYPFDFYRQCFVSKWNSQIIGRTLSCNWTMLNRKKLANQSSV